MGFQAVDRLDRPAVSIFGSARVREGSFAYDEARKTGQSVRASRAGPSSPAVGLA